MTIGIITEVTALLCEHKTLPPKDGKPSMHLVKFAQADAPWNAMNAWSTDDFVVKGTPLVGKPCKLMVNLTPDFKGNVRANVSQLIAL